METKDTDQRWQRVRTRLLASDAAFLRAVAEHEDAVCVTHDARYVFANAAHARMVGAANPEALLGRSVAEYGELGDRERISSRLAQIGAGARSVGRAVYTHTWPDGRHGEVEAFSYRLVLDEDVLALSFVRDVSDQREVARALERSEAQLRHAQRIAEIGSWFLDIPTNQVTWSDEVFRIFEVDPRVVGASYDAFLALVHPDDKEAVREAYARSVETQTPYELTHRLLLPDGRVKHVHERGETFYGANGEPLRSIGTVQDVTKKVDAERQLRQSEARYRAVVEDQTELIARFLPDGTLTFVNDAGCRYLGTTREEIMRSGFQQFIVREDAAAVAAHLASFTQEAPVATIENRVRRRDGSVRWTQWTNRAFFDAQGALIELQSVGRDVTEQKLAEARIAAQLEEKEVLLREIHHRVKNNLQIISSLLYLQQQRPTSEEALSSLRESTGRVAAMALIHEKLYASSDLARIDMRGYVLDLVASLFATYGVSTDRVRFDVHGDSFALELDRATPCGLIFNEIISNSLKHAFPNARHGSIAVELGTDGNVHVLVLRDDGVGLPEQVRRASSKTLGLRLVERLSTQLGASLDYLDGHGTSYRLRIPKERR